MSTVHNSEHLSCLPYPSAISLANIILGITSAKSTDALSNATSVFVIQIYMHKEQVLYEITAVETWKFELEFGGRPNLEIYSSILLTYRH